MPGSDSGVPEVVATVQRRLGVLEALTGGPVSMRDLEERVERSRSTLNRAVRDLEAVGAVERAEGGYRATLTGRLAAERCRDHFDAMGDIAGANAALAPLEPDVAVSSAFLVGAEVHTATEPTPYKAEESLEEALSGATRCRFFAASLPDPDYHRLIYERTLAGELSGEAIITPSLHEVMRADFAAGMADLVATGDQRVLVAEGIDYGLFLFEWPDAGPSAALVVGGDGMEVHAVVTNDTPAALRWAEDRYRAVRERATDVTDEYRGDDGDGAGSDG